MPDFADLNLLWARWNFRTGIAQRRRVWIKMARLITNGVKLVDCVQTLRERRVRQYGKSDPVVLAMRSWERQLRNGKRFSDAIADWVPSQERMLIAAGERSGRLAESMQSASEVMVAQRNIRAAIIGGLAYPSLLVVAGTSMLYMFGYKLVPAFSQVASADRWKGMAKYVVVASRLIQDWLWLPILLALFFVGAIVWAMPNWAGEARARLDKYPPFSIYRVVQGSSWVISLAALIEAGERLEDSIKNLASVASPWLADRSNSILRGLRGGLNLGDAMARAQNGFPDPEIIDDLGVYAQMADLDMALRMVSREWIAESVATIQANMKVIFNVGIVVVASLIGFMVSGLISMQMQLGQLMQHGAR